MNKRGFIKTLEAVISILIVFIFIFAASQSGGNENSQSEVMRNLQEGLLRGITQNDDMRKCIVDADNSELEKITGEDYGSSRCPEIKKYVIDTLPDRFTRSRERFRIYICNPNVDSGAGSCIIPEDLEDKKFLYTSGVIISSNIDSPDPFNPRLLRIWMW